MLRTVIRSRALTSNLSATHFLPALPNSARVLPPPTLRPFTSSQVSRVYDNDDRRGGYARPPRESFGERRPRVPRSSPSQVLWVGNLPFSTSPERVEELFSEYGNIVSVRMAVAPTGESKGFAHIDFADIATAEAIIKANAESQFFLDGRGLYMDYADPVPPKRAFPPANTLHFTGYSGDEAMLEDALKEFADVLKNVQLMRNPQTGESNRYGFIEFATVEDATTVMNKLQGKEIAYGEPLTLSYARGKRTTFPRNADQGGEGYGYRGRGGDGRSRDYNNASSPRSFGRGGRGGFREGGEDRTYGRGPGDNEPPPY